MRVSARGLRLLPSGSAAFSWLSRGPAASMPSPACFGFPVAWSPWSALGNPARTPSHGCLPAWMPQCFVACCVRSTSSSSVTSCSRSGGLCVSRPSMGMSFFPSRKRCCPQCCQRRITVNGEEVIEYYHAGVVCYLVGYEIPIPLDVELIGPGEVDTAAAQRLLLRVLENYPRFFDAIVADAAYLQIPFLRFCLKHRLDVVAVLKKNQLGLLTDATALLGIVSPRTWDRGNVAVQAWDMEGFTLANVPAPTPENASQSGSTAMAVGRRAKRPANGTGQPRSPHRGCPSRPFGKLLTPDGRSRTICSTTCPRTGRSTTATPMNRRPS